MIKQCNNCIHYNSCKDRIELDRLIHDFEEISNANTIADGIYIGLPPEERIRIEYEMWCKYWLSGLEDNKENDSDGRTNLE